MTRNGAVVFGSRRPPRYPARGRIRALQMPKDIKHRGSYAVYGELLLLQAINVRVFLFFSDRHKDRGRVMTLYAQTQTLLLFLDYPPGTYTLLANNRELQYRLNNRQLYETKCH